MPTTRLSSVGFHIDDANALHRQWRRNIDLPFRTFEMVWGLPQAKRVSAVEIASVLEDANLYLHRNLAKSASKARESSLPLSEEEKRVVLKHLPRTASMVGLAALSKRKKRTPRK